MSVHALRATKRSSAATRSTTSRRSCRSPTPTSTRSSTSSRTTPTRSSRGTTRCARPQLRKLYEKAKVGQWNATTDLPWDTDVDLEKVVDRRPGGVLGRASTPDHYDGTVVEKWGEKEWLEFGIDQRRWTLSQFLHGEQGALLCTAKIVETVPWYDAKLYAATQVVDEARHVEVFHRYIDEKLGGGFQVNAHLRMLLDDIIKDSRWDMTYLGMQVMVEGLALAAFGFLHQMTEEPLLKQLLRYVMSDEARHVAFGVLSLQGGLRRDDRRGDEGPPGVRVRGRGPHARPVPVAGGVGEARRQPARRGAARAPRPDPRPVPADAVLARSCPTARSSACSTATTSGCATASRRWASSSSRTGRTPASEYIKFELGGEVPAPA